MPTKTTKNRPVKYTAAFVSALLMSAGVSWAQQAPAPSAAPAPAAAPVPVVAASAAPADEDTVVLTPFEVSAKDTKGYAAATTLAGNRLNTELRDIGNAVSVITSQFMKDIGATDNTTLLQYTTNTEVGSVYGNFQGAGDGAALDEAANDKLISPNQNTRVRGLTYADNSRDYFLTDIPWEGYSVDGVDLQRGPNSILFGQGSPAGMINTRTKQAMFKDANEVGIRIGSYGSYRATLDVNKVLVKDELALRIASVYNDEEFKQDPAFSLNKRIYGAARWEPKFLKQGSARTVFKADYEAGDITSNNPRTLPPIDLITPWFATGTYQARNSANQPTTYNYTNRATYYPVQLTDNNTGLPNRGNAIANLGAGGPNVWYNPWLGNFGQQFGNPTFFYNDNASALAGKAVNWEPRSNHGIGPDGAIDTTGVGGIHYQRPGGIAPYQQFAKNARLPYWDFGIYKDKSLTDASVFDFYNNLIDGPNKKEWQSFRTYKLSWAQTFFHDQAGFEATYNNEFYKNGQQGILSGEKVALGIDLNSYYSDGTGIGPDGQYGSGGGATPNPNVGRPFISDSAQFASNSRQTDRENTRLTGFVSHDFTKDAKNTLNTILGRQIVTGNFGHDKVENETRSWQRYGTDNAYEAFVNNIGNPAKIKFTDNTLTPNTVIYLGPSLAARSSASGAYIPNPSAVQVIKTGTVRTFDSTWNRSTIVGNANYVDPAAPWTDTYQPGSAPSTQSENPANYVGFRDVPVTVLNADDSPAIRDYLTTSAGRFKSEISSKALTWQGHFWNNSLVGTYGVRQDVEKVWQKSMDTNSSTTDAYGHLNLAAPSFLLNEVEDQRTQVTSHAWTGVVHFESLPGLDKVMKDFPILISAFYNHSTNFQPAANRVDLYGTPLGPPQGITKDYGILLETKDGKYSVKVNKFETTSTNQTSQALGGTWFIGSSQAWSANWVNRFEFNWNQNTNAGAIPASIANDPTNGNFSQYNYSPAPLPGGGFETQAEASAREAAVIAAYRAWQKSVDPRFYAAWKINLNDPTKEVAASNPNGFAVTEDSVSKGYEIEFNAIPVKNWRIAVNASKTNATRSNIGGAALTSFIKSYEKALKTTPAGDLRIWWGSPGSDTSLFQWNTNIGSEFAQRSLQEGTNVPELREWRVNVINDYSFDHGKLKGFNVGAGIRYESSVAIGYKPLPGATANDISFDIENPYMGPAETNFDFWVGYSRRIWHNIDWNIQLNVRNAFAGNDLIPISVQPDGSPAAYRIQPPQTWQLSNTFRF